VNKFSHSGEPHSDCDLIQRDPIESQVTIFSCPQSAKGVFWHGLSSSSAGNLYQPLASPSHYLSQELSLQEGGECWWQVLTLLCGEGGGGGKW